jgi:release factor glutamine methyltransferase
MRDPEAYPGLAATRTPGSEARNLQLLAPELLDRSHLDTLDDPVETALYARLVSLAVKTLGAHSVLDVGCGCGIPTLAAARAGASRVVGIDIMAHNVELTRVNVRRANLQQRVSALQGSWEDLCDGRLDAGTFDLVVANPPYVPSGLGIVVDGGPTGTRMIDSIIDHLPADSGLALLFGSISDPLGVLDRLARRGLALRELLVQSVPFGRYTSRPATLAHLRSLRERGTTWFCDTARAGNTAPHAYLTLGAVTTRADASGPPPNDGVAALAELLDAYQRGGPGVVPEGSWLLELG